MSTETNIFSCKKCNKQYTTRAGFRLHMQVHTGRYSYYCDMCRRGFTNKSEYDRHMRAHAGLKYHCEYCSKPFMSKEKLRYHLSLHTGQYKFRCEKCGKGLNKKYEFIKHGMSHATKHWGMFDLCEILKAYSWRVHKDTNIIYAYHYLIALL